MSSNLTDDNETARYLASYIYENLDDYGPDGVLVTREALYILIKEFYDSLK